MREKVAKSFLSIFLILAVITLLNSHYSQPKWIPNESYFQEENASLEIHQQLVTTQFYENLGQVRNNEITFFGSIEGGHIGFGTSKVFMHANGDNNDLTLSFEGAQFVSPKGIGVAEHKANFFLGERGTYTNVKVYTSILYENLWSGIDLVYKGTNHGIKYEFQVEPGANPAQIKVRCEGHDTLMIGKDSLNIKFKDTSLIDSGLVVIQNQDEIDAEFIPLGSCSYGFQVDTYDYSEPLIIDPLVYFTTFNASLDEFSLAMTIDSYAQVYCTGFTESWDFPAIDSYDDELDGPTDCFVLKLSPDGTSIVYSTFIGGSDREQGDGIRVDTSGNAYISGWTNSADFPTVNPYNDVYDGAGSIFVCKLSPLGNELIYSTYVGGSDAEGGSDIAIDIEGNAYVTGWTYSEDFPTLNAFDYTHNGGNNGDDAFVFKLNPDGNELIFSTFVGGTGDDVPRGIEVDFYNNVYVTGSTDSEDFPTTEGAYETEDYLWLDVFVFKLSPTGDSLIYSTYISARRWEIPNDIAVDAYGAAYIVGMTNSADFPEVNAYDPSFNGFMDCFILKLSPTGDYLLYSTRIGGNDTEQLLSVAVDQNGYAYAGGFTDSYEFPTANAYNATYPGGDTSGIILKMDADGNELLYSTFIGGGSDDFISSIDIDANGTVYAAGITIGFLNDTHNIDNSSATFVVKLTDWSDGDRDNMPHAWELEYGLNPIGYDGDLDLDSDGLINSDEYRYGTNPSMSDTDGDGYSDGLEVETGYSPLDPEVGIIQLLSYNLVYILIVAGVITLIVLYLKKDTLYDIYWNR